MKKLALVIVVLLFASAASAQVIINPTTNARMDGLGVANHQIVDDFNIWNNPAQINNYKSGIYGELGNYSSSAPIVANDADQTDVTDQWGGIHMEMAGAWGIYLGRPYDGPFSASGALDVLEAGGAGTAPAANRFDIFYGIPGAMPLGFYLSYANQSEENATTDEASEFNLGAGAVLLDGMLDVALNIGLVDSKLDPGVESDAGPSFSLFARLQQAHTGGKYLYSARIITADASTEDVDHSVVAWGIDATCNSNPNDDTLLVLGAGLFGSSEGNDETLDTIAIPVNLAVEHQTFKKVKTRFGLAKAIYSSSTFDDGTTETTTVADGPASVSAGFGWMVHDNLMVDAVINQDVLFTGSYFVSGVPESLSSKISATYRFQ
jgi:hypothetical protein